MKKIILVGYMGSGKTTIGKELADNLQIPFIDLDQYIEVKEQLKITDIFDKKGEVYFRKKEHMYLKELMERTENFVLSLGGGTPCYANNHLYLQSKDVESIYLKASITTLENRLTISTNRPLLKHVTNLKEYIAQHLFERNYFYNFSQHTIVIDNKDTEIIVDEILKL
ncbi:MAG: shikimate kinase [Myroides sp.]|nr:shikimate kinase [Myroides sp.]